MIASIRRLVAVAALATLVSAGGTAANAAVDLTGDLIHAAFFNIRGPLDYVDLGSFVVPDVINFTSAPFGAGPFSGSYAFTGQQITFTAGSAGATWGHGNSIVALYIRDTPKVHIMSVTLDKSSTANGVKAGDAYLFFGIPYLTNPYSYQGIDFYFQGQTWAPGQSAVFDLQLGDNVPEPATWAMLLAGFGALGAATRNARRRSKAMLA